MNFLILAILTFGLLLCRTSILFILYLIMLIIYIMIYHKINFKSLILILVIYVHSLSPYVFFNNIVLETHQNYVIASVNYQKVLIYIDEPYFFNEKITILNESKDIESNSNLNIFNFEMYMRQQNITKYYQSKDVTIHKSNSLQRKVYERIIHLNDDSKKILLQIFYQFDTDNDLIYSSGIHYSYLNQLITSTCSIFLSTIFLFFFSLLFPYKFAIQRILIGNMIKQLFKNMSIKDQIGFQYLICMLVMPSCVFSLSFVLPFLLNINHLFIHNKKARTILNKLMIAFLQFLYTNSCNILSLVFFNLLKKLNGILLLLGMIQLILHQVSFIQLLSSFLNIISSWNLSWIIYGHVSFGLFILSLWLYYRVLETNIISYLSFCFLLLVPLQAYYNPFYCVDFINVGQGDCILIRAPFNQNNIIIDIPYNKEKIVIDYLHALGIHSIDTLIFTHHDSDHNGGKDAFIEHFQVNEIIEEPIDILSNNIDLISINETNHLNDNDNSLVYYSRIGGLNYCFMGDASKKVELELIDKYDFDCDVIKIGHHGSETSTDRLFIQSISPKMAIISVGKNNRYGHPHDSVLKTLNDFSISTYQTSKDGSISIKSFLMFHFVTTSSWKFGIMLKE
ncbi:MAG: ComEC/Rec2 family competence protein [Traorella sp.]